MMANTNILQMISRMKTFLITWSQGSLNIWHRIIPRKKKVALPETILISPWKLKIRCPRESEQQKQKNRCFNKHLCCFLSAKNCSKCLFIWIHLIINTTFGRYEFFSPPFYRWWDWGREVKSFIQGHVPGGGSAGIRTKEAPPGIQGWLSQIKRNFVGVCYLCQEKKEGQWEGNEAEKEKNQRKKMQNLEKDEARALLLITMWLKGFSRGRGFNLKCYVLFWSEYFVAPPRDP